MSRQELTRRASRRSIATARSGFAVQRDWIAEWGDFLLAPEELIDLGEGGVFVSGVGVTGRIVGSCLTSGAGFGNC